MRRPYVRMLGDWKQPEFASAIEYLRREAKLANSASRITGSKGGRLRPIDPDLILLVASCPGRFSAAEVESLQRRFPQTRLVASLAPNASDVSYLAVYDAATGEVALSHVSGERGAGRDYELWMVEGQNAPVSMGVIPAGDTARLAVKPEIRAKLDKGVALAISLEPAGGSPNGQPTTVVAVGGLQSL